MQAAIKQLEINNYRDRNHFAADLTELLIGAPLHAFENDCDGYQHWCDTYRAFARALHHSIDAALKLVPEGWDWSLHSPGHTLTGHIQGASKPTPTAGVWYFSTNGDAIGESTHPVPALALLIATLKARQSMEGWG